MMRHPGGRVAAWLTLEGLRGIERCHQSRPHASWPPERRDWRQARLQKELATLVISPVCVRQTSGFFGRMAGYIAYRSDRGSSRLTRRGRKLFPG